MNYKYLVITFNFDGYELLRDPLVVDENADYICFSDDLDLMTNVWKLVYVEGIEHLSGVQKTYLCKYNVI